MLTQNALDDFFDEQLEAWPEAKAGFEALDNVLTRRIDIDGFPVVVTHNPARLRSSSAKTDKASIAARPCFLCDANRPALQRHLDWRGYRILVNPFPILPRHFTIVAREHRPQSIEGAVADMTALACLLPDFAIFYNGPACGASAPDHFHFQAVRRDTLPMFSGAPIPFGTIRLTDDMACQEKLDEVMSRLPHAEGETEAKVNIFCTAVNGRPEMTIIPRRRHRPDFYGDEGMLVSPASIDLAGVMVAPRREDFDKFSPEIVRNLYSQLCFSQAEINCYMAASRNNSRPQLAVGLMSAPEIDIDFIKGFEYSGPRHFSAADISKPIIFVPVSEDSVFEVSGVTIGVGFHWEERQTQRFRGAVELHPDTGAIVVINHIDVEDYLCSVISSEMNADSPFEFLKAHAVISRSWLLRQIGRRNASEKEITPEDAGCDELIRWYDREDHTLFDVCADDHCQRYQGITRLTSDIAVKAVKETEGMVLTYGDGCLCDARFSKCCGGVTEVFGTCWGQEEHPYLQAFRDILPTEPLPDLTTENGVKAWILSRPASFCNTSDKTLLGKVLNKFDQSTMDFYRWKVCVTSTELAEIIRSKSGIDMGEIIDLVPLDRGPSGRLFRLKIAGTKRTLTVGKELEIRRLLSPTHLYSSAFIVEKSQKNGDDDKKITTFTLRGAGWGHGVGLCQIGAAAMSEAGYGFEQILAHYYPDTTLTKAYD